MRLVRTTASSLGHQVEFARTVRLPITRKGSPGSFFIAGTATATSSRTTEVLAQVSGGSSDLENTTFGSASMRVNGGSPPPAVISDSAR